MNANKALITHIINNSTLLEVPFFQRSYVWTEDLWARLLEDMEFVAKTKKQHFLGSIILKMGAKPEAGELFSVRKTIVDGQQRLTTFLIFLKVLSLKLKQPTWFDFQFRIMGQDLALRHGKNDIAAFEKVMGAKSDEIIDNSAPGSKVIAAFNYFINHIDETKLDIMTVVVNTQFVCIDLDKDEDEQQIFDTLNSLGVNLTTSELLKNSFFSRDTIDEYESKWAAVFEKDDEAKMYWGREIETGRIKRALIDIFFDAYFQLFIQNKKYSISNEDKLMYARTDRLAQSYQHFINNYCDGNKNVILGQLKEYAQCFREIFDPDNSTDSNLRKFGIERLNIIIFGLKTTTLIPYVLYITKNIPDEEVRNQMYGILESYIMRRIIVHATTKNYNNLFTSLILNSVLDPDSLIAKLERENDASTYIPNDEELLDGFKTSKLVNLQSRGIIYLIECRLYPTSSSTSLLGFDGYSLEHLMPKKWRNKWKDCTSEDDAQKRDSKLLTLGNLAIIAPSLNASIRDGDWQTKKEGRDGKPGLNLCASGLVTLHDALQKPVWNEKEIDARAQWLWEQATALWKIS